MKRGWTGGVLFSLVAELAAQASSPEVWTVSRYEELLDGQPDGVRLSSEGTISVGLRVEEIFHSADDPTLWSVATEPGGSVVAGTGVTGRVFRIQPESGGWRSSQVFDSDELQITALAVTRDGKVRFTTAPEGALYQLEASGASEILRPRQPGDRYLWSLALAPDGSMYLGSGTDGRLYRVGPDGEGKVFYDSDQTHITALALGSRGELFAGSDGDGLIYQLDAAGRAQVLYDAPLREIRALTPGPRGVLYALAVGERPAPPVHQRFVIALPEVESPLPGETAMPLPPAFGEDQRAGVEQPQLLLPAPAAAPPATTRGELYRIDPDGAVTRLWTSQKEVPLALLSDGDAAVLVGTGEDGRIYRVEVASGNASLWARLEAAQVTALARGEDGAVLAACSGAGRLYRLAGQAERGSYVSPVRDAGAKASWGAILVGAEIPNGSSLQLETRSGNSSRPDDSWSNWAAARAGDSGTLSAASPAARFLQWRALLSAGGSGVPELRSVGVVYHRLNGKPDVTQVAIDPPGTYYRTERSAEDTNSLPAQASQNDGDHLPGRARTFSGTTAERRYRLGWRSIRWDATDPDGDSLAFALYLKARSESNWKLLAQDLEQPRFSFDSTAFPDGSYQARITATDAPSNASASAQLDAALSPAFTVDNTGPEILDLNTAAGTARFRVHDALSPLRKVEVRVDDGDWKLVDSADGSIDSLDEHFELPLGAGRGGAAREVAVRATDLALNTTVSRSAIP